MLCNGFQAKQCLHVATVNRMKVSYSVFDSSQSCLIKTAGNVEIERREIDALAASGVIALAR